MYVYIVHTCIFFFFLSWEGLLNGETMVFAYVSSIFKELFCETLVALKRAVLFFEGVQLSFKHVRHGYGEQAGCPWA